MTIADLISAFEAWADPAWQERWDNCGWQIQPDILAQAPQVLVCLTPTLAVMQEAIACQQQGVPINLIVAHHPLIFSPLKSVQSGTAIGDMIALAYQHGIGVYSAHTNFDQVTDGTADVLAQLFYLQQPRPIVPTSSGYGYGRVGQLAPTLSLSALLDQVQTVLQPPHLIVSPAADLTQRIEYLAVLGGSGASYLEAVAQTPAQAYLTSDCKFHQFQEARDRGLVLIDAGHYATERPACARLVQRLQEMGAVKARLSQQDEDFRQFPLSPLVPPPASRLETAQGEKRSAI